MSNTGRIYHFDHRYGLTAPRFGDFHLYQVGELYGDVGFSNGGHQQWCYEITLIESGVGTVKTNGRSFAVHAGDMIITGHNCYHEIIADQDNRLQFLYLGFDVAEEKKSDPLFAEVLQYFDTTKDACVSDRFGVGEMMHRLLQEFNSEYTGFQETVACYLKLIMLLAYRNGHPVSQPATMSDDSEELIGVAVYRVIRYVDEHLFTVDSIRTIANELNYNYSYLSYMFRKHTGITLREYITQKKMERAQSLLLERGQSVSQVAAILGYKNPQSFSKVFSNIYKMSPSAFMKQHQKEEPTP